MLNNLAHLSTWFARALMYIAVILTALMALHIFADICARMFFSYPLPGTLEIARHYYLVPMTFLPLASVELRREHVVVEAFTHFLPISWIKVLDILVRLVCIACLTVFVWRTGLQAVNSTIANEDYSAVFFDVPIWPVRWVLPFSFAAFAFAMLSTTLKPVHLAADQKPETEV